MAAAAAAGSGAPVIGRPTTIQSALAAIAWPELRNSLASAEFYGVQGVYSVPAWPFRGLIVAGSAAAALCYLLSIPGIVRRRSATTASEDPLGGGA